MVQGCGEKTRRTQNRIPSLLHSSPGRRRYAKKAVSLPYGCRKREAPTQDLTTCALLQNPVRAQSHAWRICTRKLFRNIGSPWAASSGAMRLVGQKTPAAAHTGDFSTYAGVIAVLLQKPVRAQGCRHGGFVRGAHFNKRQAAGTSGKTHLVHGLFYGDGVDLHKEIIAQFQVF